MNMGAERVVNRVSILYPLLFIIIIIIIYYIDY